MDISESIEELQTNLDQMKIVMDQIKARIEAAQKVLDRLNQQRENGKKKVDVSTIIEDCNGNSGTSEDKD